MQNVNTISFVTYNESGGGETSYRLMSTHTALGCYVRVHLCSKMGPTTIRNNDTHKKSEHKSPIKPLDCYQDEDNM